MCDFTGRGFLALAFHRGRVARARDRVSPLSRNLPWARPNLVRKHYAVRMDLSRGARQMSATGVFHPSGGFEIQRECSNWFYLPQCMSPGSRQRTHRTATRILFILRPPLAAAAFSPCAISRSAPEARRGSPAGPGASEPPDKAYWPSAPSIGHG